jgi:hypothetical protein
VSPIKGPDNNTLRVVLGGSAVAAAVILGTIIIDPGGDTTTGTGTTTTATTTGTTTTTTTTTVPPAPYDCTGMTLHTPGGPDGAGGCWPGPGNTGPTVTPTAVLSAPGGDRYVYNTTVTISDKIINYAILVQAGGHATLHNVVMNGTIDVEDPSASLTTPNHQIHGGASPRPPITGDHQPGGPTQLRASRERHHPPQSAAGHHLRRLLHDRRARPVELFGVRAAGQPHRRHRQRVR